MQLYSYKAKDRLGKNLRGVCCALNLTQLRQQLHGQKILLLVATPYQLQTLKAPTGAKISWWMQMGQLLHSGLALWDCLNVLQKEATHQVMKGVSMWLGNYLRTGGSLAAGMQRFSSLFDPQVIAMIAAAQATGSLTTTVEQITVMLDKRWKFIKHLQGVMTYPLLLMGVACVVVAVLLLFVIPALEPLFSSAPTGMTAVIMEISHIAQSWGLWAVVGLLGVCVGGFVLFRNTARLWISLLLMKAPIAGSLWQRLALVRFFDTMSHLQKAQVPFMEAFSIARKILGHPHLERAFRMMETQLLQGKSLSVLLEKEPEVPRGMVQLLRIGEQSGDLAACMGQLASFYEEQTRTELTKWTQLAQPLMLLFLAMIVAAVLLAVLIPLTQSSALVVGT